MLCSLTIEDECQFWSNALGVPLASYTREDTLCMYFTIKGHHCKLVQFSADEVLLNEYSFWLLDDGSANQEEYTYTKEQIGRKILSLQEKE